MKIVAKRPVQLAGHIFRKGESRDWDGPIDERIAANFTAADGSPLETGAQGDAPGGELPGLAQLDENALIDRTVKALRREGIVQQLDAMNITYSASSNTRYLAKLLLMNKGELQAEQ